MILCHKRLRYVWIYEINQENSHEMKEKLVVCNGSFDKVIKLSTLEK